MRDLTSVWGGGLIVWEACAYGDMSTYTYVPRVMDT